MKRNIITGIILSVVFFYGILGGFQYKINDMNSATKIWMRDAIRAEEVKNDTHGGETPQETLDLFIEALEQRDFELASKYFVLEEQDKGFKTVANIKDQGRLEDMLSDLRRARPARGTDLTTGEVRFVIDYQERADFPIDFTKNVNGVWKIKRL